MKRPRLSILHQAAVRLGFGLGLLTFLVGASTALVYRAALTKASEERVAGLAAFYGSRLNQLERQWDLQTTDVRARIEYSRILENRQGPYREELQAFLTVQGGMRQFSQLLIEDRSGNAVFDFGKQISLRDNPVSLNDDRGWYLDRRQGRLYRVFTDRVWLGQEGNGRLAMFYPVDNALLFGLASPGAILTAGYRGLTVASSAGSAGAATSGAEAGAEAQLTWSGSADSPVTLTVRSPVTSLFSMGEMAVGVSLVPLVDGLIIWLILGIWLMRSARRVGHLGEAVDAFSRQPTVTAELRERLQLAAGGADDEIRQVAHAIEVMAEQMAQREREREAEEAARRLAAMVFANSSEAIVITDNDNSIVAVNAAFQQLTGFAEADVLGRNPRLLSAGRETPEFYAEMWRQIEKQGYWRGEVHDRRKDGSVYPKWLSIAAVRDAGGRTTNYVGMFSDITERKVAEERIIYLATHDALTGLPNRRLLTDRLEDAIALARREGMLLALLFLDLDRFKWVNDSLGHDSGDALLQAVAERLRLAVRETDTVARLGGDEFVVLLRNPLSVADVGQVGRKVVEALAQPLTLKEQTLNVSTSVGISLYPHDGVTPAALLQQADTAMYAAKGLGGNQISFFDASMNRSAVERLEIEHGLRHALECGEFELFYQPKIRAQGDKAWGAEVLLRWRHPVHGLLSPDRFIPVAEETGFIVDLGAWVIRTACSQVRRWHDAGRSIALAINLSAAQLERDDFASSVAHLAAEAGIPAGLVEFEVTESTVLRNPERSMRTLHRLREQGFGLALEDFGTGYSSLSYLKQLPFMTVKIDRSFVGGLPDEKGDVQIVRMIVALAHSVGLEVVAEGIETPAQERFLVQLGCDMLQGYLFAKPMPMAEFEAWLEGNARPVHAARQAG